mgnify:CR=1 FL=1
MARPVASGLKAYLGLGGGAKSALADARNPLGLEATERRVLDAMAAGYAEADVQRSLCIGARELGQQVRSIYRKLHLDLHAGEFARQAA